MYMETSKTMYSKVLAIIKDTSKNDINSFQKLKHKNACFPEYGGIGNMNTTYKYEDIQSKRESLNEKKLFQDGWRS